MKILLVNNQTLHLRQLAKALEDNEVEIQDYRPEIKFHSGDKDLVILSGGGGEGKEVNDYHRPDHLWYEDEINLVLSTDKPLIGICMGFEIIAAAFGSKVEEVNAYFEDFKPVHLTESGAELFGHKVLSQYEAHNMGVRHLHYPLVPLAYSEHGIEIFKHRSRPIIATQFHPEFPDGTLGLRRILKFLER
jgi:GMP synthase-like glutamine amidotransferase